MVVAPRDLAEGWPSVEGAARTTAITQSEFGRVEDPTPAEVPGGVLRVAREDGVEARERVVEVAERVGAEARAVRRVVMRRVEVDLCQNQTIHDTWPTVHVCEKEDRSRTSGDLRSGEARSVSRKEPGTDLDVSELWGL